MLHRFCSWRLFIVRIDIMSRKTKKVITVLVPLVLLVVILGVYELKVKRYGMSQYVLYIDETDICP